MGMDLKPINPTKDAPKDEHGYVWGRYNWGGWRWLISHLDKWGVDTSEFKGMNDGDPISAATCKIVGDAIESHQAELIREFIDEEGEPPEKAGELEEYIKEQATRWRTCGGYEQW